MFAFFICAAQITLCQDSSQVLIPPGRLMILILKRKRKVEGRGRGRERKRKGKKEEGKGEKENGREALAEASLFFSSLFTFRLRFKISLFAFIPLILIACTERPHSQYPAHLPTIEVTNGCSRNQDVQSVLRSSRPPKYIGEKYVMVKLKIENHGGC